MEFCEECGAMLKEENGKLKCTRCSYTTKKKGKIESTEKIDKQEEVGVIKEKDTDIMPTTDEVCPECGNEEAYTWSKQTRASDESATIFFKCTECSKTWREYD